jgi:hypothetical protein
VYEKDELGNKSLYWQGEIKSGQKHVVDPKNKINLDFKDFEAALVKAGLYNKEATAMLATWKDSYFEKPGMRIFWIVPENWVNTILPLSISPAPKQTNRVFVGRYDILSPVFETRLFNMWAKGKWFTAEEQKKERFYLAYKELVEKHFEK